VVSLIQENRVNYNQRDYQAVFVEELLKKALYQSEEELSLFDLVTVAIYFRVFMWYMSYMAFAGHVLRGSSGKDLLDVLEGKLNSKLSQGRPRKMWLDDIKSWTRLNSYEKIKNLANDRKSWRACRITCQPSDTEEDS